MESGFSQVHDLRHTAKVIMYEGRVIRVFKQAVDFHLSTGSVCVWSTEYVRSGVVILEFCSLPSLLPQYNILHSKSVECRVALTTRHFCGKLTLFIL